MNFTALPTVVGMARNGKERVDLPVYRTKASGFISQAMGNYERSIEQAKKAIALDPDHTFA